MGSLETGCLLFSSFIEKNSHLGHLVLYITGALDITNI